MRIAVLRSPASWRALFTPECAATGGRRPGDALSDPVRHPGPAAHRCRGPPVRLRQPHCRHRAGSARRRPDAALSGRRAAQADPRGRLRQRRRAGRRAIAVREPAVHRSGSQGGLQHAGRCAHGRRSRRRLAALRSARPGARASAPSSPRCRPAGRLQQSSRRCTAATTSPVHLRPPARRRRPLVSAARRVRSGADRHRHLASRPGQRRAAHPQPRRQRRVHAHPRQLRPRGVHPLGPPAAGPAGRARPRAARNGVALPFRSFNYAGEERARQAIDRAEVFPESRSGSRGPYGEVSAFTTNFFTSGR